MIVLVFVILAIVGCSVACRIAASKHHSCIETNGRAKCVGYNGYGQLGDSTTQARTIFTDVVSLNRGVTDVCAGYRHSGAIKDGGVWAWGNDAGVGVLGIGVRNGATMRIPVQVVALDSDVSAISCQYRHMCAIRRGALFCWGYNGNGALGDGTRVDKSAPTRVAGFDDSTESVSAGDDLTCAIRAGEAYCWGRNHYGSVGVGSTVGGLAAPQRLIALQNPTYVVAGREHACAVHNGGAATCWGLGTTGQLGDGSKQTRSAPNGYASGFGPGGDAVAEISIMMDTRATCFRLESGAVKCTGNQDQGQLGIGTTGGSRTVASSTVAGLDRDVQHIASGFSWTFAFSNNGSLLGWGRNDNGQIGLADKTHRSAPGRAVSVNCTGGGFVPTPRPARFPTPRPSPSQPPVLRPMRFPTPTPRPQVGPTLRPTIAVATARPTPVPTPIPTFPPTPPPTLRPTAPTPPPTRPPPTPKPTTAAEALTDGSGDATGFGGLSMTVIYIIIAAAVLLCCACSLVCLYCVLTAGGDKKKSAPSKREMVIVHKSSQNVNRRRGSYRSRRSTNDLRGGRTQRAPSNRNMHTMPPAPTYQAPYNTMMSGSTYYQGGPAYY